jgi:hypothetical protein
MRWATDPLALDSLGSIGIGPLADVYAAPAPLALEPFSPVDSAARPIDASREQRDNRQARGMT